MKAPADLVRGIIRKARSDSTATAALLNVGSYDTACFHAQQAAEKFLKAYLTWEGVAFPYTHNLIKLVELCAGNDTAFQSLLPAVTPLVPYAVELRYDTEFWPDANTAQEARSAALAIEQFVLAHLPESVTQELSEQ